MTFDLVEVARDRLARARTDPGLALAALLEALSEISAPAAPGTPVSERELAQLRGEVLRGLSQLLYVEYRRNLALSKGDSAEPNADGAPAARFGVVADAQAVFIDVFNEAARGALHA